MDWSVRFEADWTLRNIHLVMLSVVHLQPGIDSSDSYTSNKLIVYISLYPLAIYTRTYTGDKIQPICLYIESFWIILKILLEVYP